MINKLTTNKMFGYTRVIIKHVFMYLQKPPLLVDVYICPGEPSMISTKISQKYVIRGQQNS